MDNSGKNKDLWIAPLYCSSCGTACPSSGRMEVRESDWFKNNPELRVRSCSSPKGNGTQMGRVMEKLQNQFSTWIRAGKSWGKLGLSQGCRCWGQKGTLVREIGVLSSPGRDADLAFAILRLHQASDNLLNYKLNEQLRGRARKDIDEPFLWDKQFCSIYQPLWKPVK